MKARKTRPRADSRMSLVQLRAFVAIVETGSMMQAAGREGMSQPNFTDHIAKLEAFLGKSLFHRKNGPLRGRCFPTHAADALYPHAKSILALAANFR